ncbi:MAG: cob(I)yrinic acid a,c-diamide adenosyltransferase [Patescibacteria group bacterium]
MNTSSSNATIVVYTGEGKGKTSASLGLLVRALGAGKSVAFLQFIKHWQVSEHQFIAEIEKTYGDRLLFYKGGKGFYNAGDMSAKEITEKQHKQAAKDTLTKAEEAIQSSYDVVICDEINNAVHDGLLPEGALADLISTARQQGVSLCLTGRNFPEKLVEHADIVTEMAKLKHHYDDGVLAKIGIDY